MNHNELEAQAREIVERHGEQLNGVSSYTAYTTENGRHLPNTVVLYLEGEDYQKRSAIFFGQTTCLGTSPNIPKILQEIKGILPIGWTCITRGTRGHRGR